MAELKMAVSFLINKAYGKTWFDLFWIVRL